MSAFIVALNIGLGSIFYDPSSYEDQPRTFPTLDDFVKQSTKRPNYLADLPVVMNLWRSYLKKLDNGKEVKAKVNELDELIKGIDLKTSIRDQEALLFKTLDSISNKSVSEAFSELEARYQRAKLLHYNGVMTQVNLKAQLDSQFEKINSLIYMVAKKSDKKYFPVFINLMRLNIGHSNADIQRFGVLKIREIYGKNKPDFTKERNSEILKFLYDNISDHEYASVFWFAEGVWHYEIASGKEDVISMLGEVKYVTLPLKIQRNIACQDTKGQSPESVSKKLPSLLRNDGSFYDVLIRDYANIRVPSEEKKK